MKGKEDATSGLGKKTPIDLPVPSSPTECPTPAYASAMLAKEMNQLSVEEREKILEDVHGIPRVADEPQEFIEACLALLGKELNIISNKAAYDLASSMSKEYTSRRTRRLMFLRAESFDPCKAASRMVRFFEEKYQLFGADKLTKDIVLADLDPDDIATLEKGIYQVLPEKDCAGRKVICFFPKLLKMVPTIQNVSRVLYYLLMRSVEDDEEAQKRGVVGCAYAVGAYLKLDLKNVRNQVLLRKALPVRYQSAHVCYNNPLMLPVFSFAVFMMGPHTRMRFRTHYGSDEECQCQLSSFGFPMSALPVSSRGEFNLENHRAYMATERSIEAKKSKRKGPLCVAQKGEKKTEENAQQAIIKEDVIVAVPQPILYDLTGYRGFMSLNNWGSLSQPSFANPWWNVVGAPNLPPVVPPHKQLAVVPQSHIIGPTSASRPLAKICESPSKSHVIYDPWPSDVLFGRGKPIQQRPGNVRFREMIDNHIDKYEQGVNGGKAVASAYVVHLVKEEGGRFLKELKDGGFVEVDEAAARAKTSDAFRTRIKLLQATLKKDKSTV